MKLRLNVDQTSVDGGDALALAVHVDSLLEGLVCSDYEPVLELVVFVQHFEQSKVANVLGLHSYQLEGILGIKGMEDGAQMIFSRFLRLPAVPF